MSTALPAKRLPSPGSYLTDGTRLLRCVAVPTGEGSAVALEDCASLAVEYYSPAQVRRLDLRYVEVGEASPAKQR
jgi:hypothetical protein